MRSIAWSKFSIRKRRRDASNVERHGGRLDRRRFRAQLPQDLALRSGLQTVRGRRDGNGACASDRHGNHARGDRSRGDERAPVRRRRHHHPRPRRADGLSRPRGLHDGRGEVAKRHRRQIRGGGWRTGMSRIGCVLFDLDGVLVDATEWHYDALNRALALFGFDITRYEHLSGYNGLPTRKKLEMLSVEKGLPTALHTMLNRLKQVYTRDEILTKCHPRFEKEYMLSRLKREGYRMAVCSNSIRETLELMVRRSGLDAYFDFVISNEDVAKAKPDPESFVAAMTRMGIAPGDTLAVDDSPHGIEAARRSGAHVCSVNGCNDVDYPRVRAAIDRANAAH